MKLKDSNKENAIIEQTLDIVYETGIAGVKMSKLAKRVGISPSTLYVYFETKEDLIVSVARRILKNIAAGLESVLAESTSFENKLRAKWIHMVQFTINHEKEINFMDQWKRSPYFDKNIFKEMKDGFKMKMMLFQEGRDSGYLKDLDDNIIHAIMAGIANQTVTLIKAGHLQMNQSTLDLTFSIIRDALKR
ncbi:TetR/AcrR family transcriptional regulator [Puteibacter caeruleilacunae]|nr:TetR/AcrR family transcriptional regulator [Puteibacter caeruleilacunae]